MVHVVYIVLIAIGVLLHNREVTRLRSKHRAEQERLVRAMCMAQRNEELALLEAEGLRRDLDDACAQVTWSPRSRLSA